MLINRACWEIEDLDLFGKRMITVHICIKCFTIVGSFRCKQQDRIFNTPKRNMCCDRGPQIFFTSWGLLLIITFIQWSYTDSRKYFDSTVFLSTYEIQSDIILSICLILFCHVSFPCLQCLISLSAMSHFPLSNV